VSSRAKRMLRITPGTSTSLSVPLERSCSGMPDASRIPLPESARQTLTIRFSLRVRYTAGILLQIVLRETETILHPRGTIGFNKLAGISSTKYRRENKAFLRQASIRRSQRVQPPVPHAGRDKLPLPVLLLLQRLAPQLLRIRRRQHLGMSSRYMEINCRDQHQHP